MLRGQGQGYASLDVMGMAPLSGMDDEPALLYAMEQGGRLGVHLRAIRLSDFQEVRKYPRSFTRSGNLAFLAAPGGMGSCYRACSPTSPRLYPAAFEVIGEVGSDADLFATDYRTRHLRLNQ
ncbi:MAG: hypothetical protein U5J95_03585 [Balneolaceae bacterium]|nr:hypothetical protein [Balneolaceae bacterium]